MHKDVHHKIAHRFHMGLPLFSHGKVLLREKLNWSPQGWAVTMILIGDCNNLTQKII